MFCINCFVVLSPGDGPGGTWTVWESCTNGSYASEFRIRYLSHQGKWYDDSGLNSIELKCKNLHDDYTE